MMNVETMVSKTPYPGDSATLSKLLSRWYPSPSHVVYSPLVVDFYNKWINSIRNSSAK